MRKLLLSAGLSAFALICQGETPQNLSAAIGELGPVMSRPPNPKDGPDEAGIAQKYHCVGPVHVPEPAAGGAHGYSLPQQDGHEEERM